MEKLSQEAITLRRKYLRSWRAKNRDKVREYNARYWEKRLEREASAAEQAAQKQKEGDTNNG
ncbi:MAG TPA: phosphatase [Candidatus Gemmiger excrementigallinarum]|uniref:Phosphatase n=1 Tax=Candidatus Gemmiger excrementigallinarum TaxID=2838609 RepID=A0A9D2EQ59_9FIRM|nr:phosphatase [Candidatus Gemmiger excrementigallinarum]